MSQAQLRKADRLAWWWELSARGRWAAWAIVGFLVAFGVDTLGWHFKDWREGFVGAAVAVLWFGALAAFEKAHRRATFSDDVSVGTSTR